MLGDAEIERILNHRLIGQRYFFRQEAPLPNAVPVPTPVGPLACWRSAPAGERPVLLHFHGNGELVHHWVDFAGPLSAWGWDTFLSEYRGYGGSAGTPLLGAMLDDIPAIVNAVGVDPSRIVVFGRSVGSIFAIEAVHRFPTLAGLVLESGIADVHERIRMRVEPIELACSEADLAAAVTARMDHRTKLSNYQGPSLVLHAEGDHLVTIDHAERNHQWAGGTDKTLVRFPHGDHNSIFSYNQAEYLRHLAHFLETVAPRGAAPLGP